MSNRHRRSISAGGMAFFCSVLAFVLARMRWIILFSRCGRNAGKELDDIAVCPIEPSDSLFLASLLATENRLTNKSYS